MTLDWSSSTEQKVTEKIEEFAKQLVVEYGSSVLPFACDQLRFLHLKSSEKEPPKPKANKTPIRVYIDGCFDLMHSGHFNALRQAKQLGDILVVGIHSDEEITRNKGPPTMNNEERLATLKACKWVDEVVMGVPYSPTVELLDELNCDFGVHGDDMPTNVSGESAYGKLMNAGRLKIIKRTEGVSTTTLVGRLLLMTREHFESKDRTDDKDIFSGILNTTKRISQFQGTPKPVDPQAKIIYLDGTFDMFHVGHCYALEQAKKLGDRLIVGIHDDLSVNEKKGKNHPVMNMHERALNVLACKYVDEVVLNAPWAVTKEMIQSLNVSVVAAGCLGTSDVKFLRESEEESDKLPVEDPYQVPKDLGIFKRIESKSNLTTDGIAERVLKNREIYLQAYQRKKKKQDTYQEESTQWRANLQEL